MYLKYVTVLLGKIIKLAEDILSISSSMKKEYWNAYNSYHESKKNLKIIQKSYDKNEKKLSKIIDGYDHVLEKGAIPISKESLKERLVELENNHLQDNLKATLAVQKADRDLEKAITSLLKQNKEMLYNKYMASSLNRKREDMPQIKGDNLDSVLLHFAQSSKGANVTKTKMKLSQMKPSQNEMSDSKIKKMLRKSTRQMINNPFLVSRDGYIMDGHHRWAADLERYGEDHQTDVYKVTLDAEELLKRLNKLKHSYKESLNGEKVEKANLNRLIRLEKSTFESEANKYTNRYVVGMIRDPKSNKILFLKRSLDDDFHPGVWNLPGGGVEEGEMPGEALVREIKEEVNLIVCPESTYLNCKIETPENSLIYYYDCSLVWKEESYISLISLLDGENIQYCFLNKEEWNQEELILDLGTHLNHIFKNSIDDQEIRLIKAIETMESAYREDLISADIYINEYKPKIQKILSTSLEKGKSAELGEQREWGGKKYQKTASGWLPVGKDRKGKEEVSEKKGSKKKNESKKYTDSELSNHARNAGENDLKRIISESKDSSLRDIAKKELDRRQREEGVKSPKKEEKDRD